MPAPRFWPAPDVAAVARRIIPQYHAHLNDPEVRIRYVFRDGIVRKNGALVLATARVVRGLNCHLADSSEEDEEYVDEADPVSAPMHASAGFFVITVGHLTWAAMQPEQRVALVDHELCHCISCRDDDENLQLTIRAHDIEEFGCIVERHGFWKSDVIRLAEAIENAPRELTANRNGI